MKDDILKSYEKASLDYGYNSNSLHKLGLDARKLEDAASKQILNCLGLSEYEVIYTSGNAESYTMISKIGNVVSNSKELLEICKNTNNKQKTTHLNLDLNKAYDDLNKYDYITIEDDIPFFGILIKRKNINIENLIHGGKSTTKYRSGTTATPLIVSFAKLVRLKYKKK